MSQPTGWGDVGPVVELFSRAAAALRPAVPFERSVLVLPEGDEGTRSFDVDASSSTSIEQAGLRRDYSTRAWPDSAASTIREADQELDRTYVADREIIASGARSVLSIPISVGIASAGLVAFLSSKPDAFTPAHATRLGPMLEMLQMALERERLWALDRSREGRRAKLVSLLPAIAGALDVRQVFLGLSSAIQEVVPHDILALALLSQDRQGVKVQAATDSGLLELPEYRFTDEADALDSNWDFRLVRDITVVEEGVLRSRVSARDAPQLVEVVTRPGPAWTRFLAEAAVRSTLRVPIRVENRPVGGLAFFSRRLDAYDEEDGALASRIADHVALALAHQKLADERSRIVEAKTRAEALASRVEVLSRELERFSAHRAIGRSAPWKRALADATSVATTDSTVLITGESGTGKEVLARLIHRGSPRADGPFVAINCAALPTELLESELFGHERGAFTGAVTSRAGTIERAASGLLFLDEVGEMSPSVQAKLLRVLQEREFQRLGGTRTLRADVRVVAATNRDPRSAMESGAFREDLYYRLSVFEIHLPPLRERPEDILVLAESFLDELAGSVGRPAAGISEDARELLLAHSWPGNVRELRNAIERAVILCHGGLITAEHLPVTVAPQRSPALSSVASASDDLPPRGIELKSVERNLLEKALARTGGNKSQAAKLLGLSRGQLYSLLRRHGMTSARR